MAKKSKRATSRKKSVKKSRVQMEDEKSFKAPTRRGAGDKKAAQKAPAPKNAGPTTHQGSQVPGAGAGPESRQDQEVRMHQERQSPGTVSQPAYGTQRLPDDVSDREKNKVMPDEER